MLIQSARESGKRLDATVFRSLKKRLLERQCRGLLEFIEPKWTLDTVVGHEAAKARLREDAALLKRGALDSLPMGYLLCGPVGTGKSFLAQCVSGEIGVPCVILKNFRSKYVGETEGQPRSACCRCCARWARWWSSSTKRTRRSAAASRTATPARRAACSG